MEENHESVTVDPFYYVAMTEFLTLGSWELEQLIDTANQIISIRDTYGDFEHRMKSNFVKIAL